MINHKDIIETINMVQKEHFDVRTTTNLGENSRLKDTYRTEIINLKTFLGRLSDNYSNISGCLSTHYKGLGDIGGF